MNPRQHRQTIARSECTRLFEAIIGRRLRHSPHSRITVANVIFLIDSRYAPSVIVDAHSPQFGYRFVNAPTIVSKRFGITKSKQTLIVRQGKCVHLQFFKYCSSRMILLFVGKPKISHIFAKDVNAIRIFATRTGATDFFHP